MSAAPSRLSGPRAGELRCPVVLTPPLFWARQLPVGLSTEQDPRPFLEADWGRALDVPVPLPHRIDVQAAAEGADLTMRGEPRRLSAAEEAALGPALRQASRWA